MNKMKSIAVFCGSSKGTNPVYQNAGLELGKYFVDNDITMVYGGGSVGIMGIIADEMMKLGGNVIGVIPKKLLDMEVGHHGITKLHVVETMHERKALMADYAEAFIALPGGIGTLEEIIEVYTWLQLGYHQKPCGFLNTNNYFEKLFDFFDHAVKEGFLREKDRENLIIDSNVRNLLNKIEN